MNNKSGKSNWVVYIVMIFVICITMSSCSGGPSKKSNPWDELGVSKKEYERTYNHYKYGTRF